MLCLGRKIGTSIDVDGPARFIVLAIRGDQVRVGIEAERNVNIVRSELVEPIEDDDDTDEGGDE